MVQANVLVLLLLGANSFIQFWVSELGDDDFDQRERASVVLGCLGRLAYPQLRQAAASDDPEVKHRAVVLIGRLQSDALAGAEERQVLMKPTRFGCQDERDLGTLLQADGKTAFILTNIIAAVSMRDTGVVEWRGKQYPARLVKSDEDLGLALFSIPCETKLPPLPIAAGPTMGLWWDHRMDLNARFKENMDLDGCKGDGAGIFTLNEDTLELALTGVDCGGWLDASTFIETPWKPGPDKIRQFLGDDK